MSTMAPARVLLRKARYHVDTETFRCGSTVIRLREVASVQVRRPLAPMAALAAAGGLAVASGFARYLYPGELPAILGLSLAALLVGWLVGTLHVTSGHFHESRALIGFVPTLRRVAMAVDVALAARRAD
jgi:hypothetical protein